MALHGTTVEFDVNFPAAELFKALMEILDQEDGISSTFHRSHLIYLLFNSYISIKTLISFLCFTKSFGGVRV